MKYFARVTAIEKKGLWVTLERGRGQEVGPEPSLDQPAVRGQNNQLPVNQIEGATGCGACAAKPACGSGLLSQLMMKKSLLWVPWQGSSSNYSFSKRSERALPEVGEWVEVGIDDRSQLLGACLMFGSPLLGILLGLLMSAGLLHFNPSLPVDGLAVFGILVGLASACFLLRFVSSHEFLRKKLQLNLLSSRF